MAQTVRSDRTAASAEVPSGGNPGILGRLGGLGSMLTRPAPAAKAGAQSRGGMTRFFFGMLILMIGSQVLYYLEALAFTKMGPSAASAHLWPASVPVLGGLTPFLLIYFLLIALLWFGLYRFNIIPRDPFGVKAQSAARANATTTATSAPGVRKTRADRRHAAVATTTTTGKGSVKVKDTNANATTSTPRVAPVTSVRTGIPGGSDKAYEQVRSMQKTRKRREVKR